MPFNPVGLALQESHKIDEEIFHTTFVVVAGFLDSIKVGQQGSFNVFDGGLRERQFNEMIDEFPHKRKECEDEFFIEVEVMMVGDGIHERMERDSVFEDRHQISNITVGCYN